MQREKEAKEVASMVRSGANVKIVGFGRAGKSTLLTSLTHELRDHNPLVDNSYGVVDPSKISQINGVKTILIDEAITMFSSCSDKWQRQAYILLLNQYLQNGISAVFALHKDSGEKEAEFDKTFPNTVRYVVNALLPEQEARETIVSECNERRIRLDEKVIDHVLAISGRTFYYIRDTVSAIADLETLDERKLIPYIARVPCDMIFALADSERSFLKTVLTAKNGTGDSQIAQELVSLGILEKKDLILSVPGSAAAASFLSSIRMLESAEY